MYSWYSWLVDINPLRWYLNALFQNEFARNNSDLSSVELEDLEDLYGWSKSVLFCICMLVSIAIIIKLFGYCVLRQIDFSSA